jgi:hypothetical protein
VGSPPPLRAGEFEEENLGSSCRIDGWWNQSFTVRFQNNEPGNASQTQQQKQQRWGRGKSHYSPTRVVCLDNPNVVIDGMTAANDTWLSLTITGDYTPATGTPPDD